MWYFQFRQKRNPETDRKQSLDLRWPVWRKGRTERCHRSASQLRLEAIAAAGFRPHVEWDECLCGSGKLILRAPQSPPWLSEEVFFFHKCMSIYLSVKRMSKLFTTYKAPPLCNLSSGKIVWVQRFSRGVFPSSPEVHENPSDPELLRLWIFS